MMWRNKCKLAKIKGDTLRKLRIQFSRTTTGMLKWSTDFWYEALVNSKRDNLMKKECVKKF